MQASAPDRESELHISGDEEHVAYAEKAIEGLLSLAARGENITAQNVRYIIKLAAEGRADKISQMAEASMRSWKPNGL